MSDLGHQDPEKEMKARWKGLMNSMKVWNNSSTAEEFERGLLSGGADEHAPLGSLDGPSGQGDGPVKLPDPCLEAVAEVEERASKLREELEKTKRERGLLRRKASEKELQEVRGHLGDAQQLLREVLVTYEYGYRVVLARFRARHPNTEVEEDLFTIHPEDDLVSMERQQAFDDSVPPEP
ncbi:hypothetical protein B296_00044933 [Ensete ventricosum]|uniref:Uncharacterized protein n=1 Tax=Ensete ventricosum TaxID=4639 RepID=A0A426WWU4_ENSVE|nr:hypothetical protein B296_00044933 [Ensete ventricosum]